MIQTDDQPRMMTALLLGEDDEPVGAAFVLRRFTLLEGGVALEFGRDGGGEGPEALAVVGTVEDAWRTLRRHRRPPTPGEFGQACVPGFILC